MVEFEVIDDAAMEQVKGGLSFSLGLDVSHTGVSVDSPLGSFSVPNPISVATDVFKTIGGSLGDLITKLSGKLTDIGQLFSFS